MLFSSWNQVVQFATGLSAIAPSAVSTEAVRALLTTLGMPTALVTVLYTLCPDGPDRVGCDVAIKWLNSIRKSVVDTMTHPRATNASFVCFGPSLHFSADILNPGAFSRRGSAASSPLPPWTRLPTTWCSCRVRAARAGIPSWPKFTPLPLATDTGPCAKPTCPPSAPPAASQPSLHLWQSPTSFPPCLVNARPFARCAAPTLVASWLGASPATCASPKTLRLPPLTRLAWTTLPPWTCKPKITSPSFSR